MDTDLKAWEFGDGPLPDYESPLAGVFDSGVTYAIKLLADMIGAKDWVGADGSETHDGDVLGTLSNVLVAGGYGNADGDLLTGEQVRAALLDKVRMDWLETKVVNVRDPMVYGSHNLFWASDDEDGEPLLRITTDNFMDAGKPAPKTEGA